jgi:hypothetical protein
MPDSIRDTLVQVFSQKDAPMPELTDRQVSKLKALRHLVDTGDSVTPEFIQLSDELRSELGPEYFDLCLEV